MLASNPFRRRLRVVLVLVLAMVLASCDHDDDDTAVGATDGTFGTTSDGGDGLPRTVGYFDLAWTLESALISAAEPGELEDANPDTDWLVLDVNIANFTEDLGFSGMRHRDVLRLLLPGETFPVEQAYVLLPDGSREWSSLGSSPLSDVDKTWVFEIPAGTTMDDVIVQVGLNEDHKVLVPLTGSIEADPAASVSFSTTTFGGDYSFNAVDFVLSGGFASLDRGVYASGIARPGGLDRRADEGIVFVNFDLQATQYSTSPVGGVNPGAHVLIDQDGVTHACEIDAPGLYGSETIDYGVSCPVPIGSSSLTLVMSSGKCAGGCISVDHEIVVDTSFMSAFG